MDQLRGSEGVEYRDYDYSSTQAPSETAEPSSEPNETAVQPVTSEPPELTEEHGRDMPPVVDDRAVADDSAVASGEKTTRSGRVSRAPGKLKDYVY